MICCFLWSKRSSGRKSRFPQKKKKKNQCSDRYELIQISFSVCSRNIYIIYYIHFIKMKNISLNHVGCAAGHKWCWPATRYVRWNNLRCGIKTCSCVMTAAAVMKGSQKYQQGTWNVDTEANVAASLIVGPNGLISMALKFGIYLSLPLHVGMVCSPRKMCYHSALPQVFL